MLPSRLDLTDVGERNIGTGRQIRLTHALADSNFPNPDTNLLILCHALFVHTHTSISPVDYISIHSISFMAYFIYKPQTNLSGQNYNEIAKNF